MISRMLILLFEFWTYVKDVNFSVCDPIEPLPKSRSPVSHEANNISKLNYYYMIHIFYKIFLKNL